jgi:hypothetical protein
MPGEMLETIAVAGIRLRIEFSWHVDRYRHVVSLIDPGGNRIPLLESIEGSPADDWPTSPPLQNLHCESQPDGSRVALLVGMAGPGHWSASIGPHSNENRLVFDLACRASRFAGRLGTSYRLTDGVRVESAAADFIRLQASGNTVDMAASLEGATRCELFVLDSTELRIQPAEISAGNLTRRWLYEMAMQPLTSDP